MSPAVTIKARIIEALSQDEPPPYSEIAKTVGCDPSTVAKVAAALNLEKRLPGRGNYIYRDIDLNSLGLHPDVQKWIVAEAKRLRKPTSYVVRCCIVRCMP